MKKYTVNYTSGATGYGWEKKYERLDEFEDFINEKRKDYTARVTVWDEELEDFIFWKDTLTWDCEVDILKDSNRVCRTITRRRKHTERGCKKSCVYEK